jgi:hypothetical protein
LERQVFPLKAGFQEKPELGQIAFEAYYPEQKWRDLELAQQKQWARVEEAVRKAASGLYTE